MIITKKVTFFINFSCQTFSDHVLCNKHCEQQGAQATEKAVGKTDDEMQCVCVNVLSALSGEAQASHLWGTDQALGSLSCT